jgi:hypothetical protein
MLNERYVCTMSMSLGLPVDYDGDRPVFLVSEKKVRRFVEKQRPSLKGKDFKVLPIEKEVKDLWLH